MNQAVFILPHKPVAYKMPRVYRSGAINLNSEMKKNLQIYLAGSITRQKREFLEDIEEYPLSVSLRFAFPVPKGTSKKRKAFLEENTYPKVTKPDIDNLVKQYLDVGNGILYSDDRVIVEINACKFYSHLPRVEYMIKKYTGDIDG